MKTAKLLVLVVVSMCACSYDGDPMVNDTGQTATGGTMGSGGMAATGGGLSSAGVPGSAGVLSTGGIDAGVVQACPEYPHLSHDGTWVGEAVIIESTCDDIPIGSTMPAFSTFMIETQTLDPLKPWALGLELYDANGEFYRARVSEDHSRPVGPLETEGGSTITTNLSLDFAGNCLTGVILFEAELGWAGGCRTRANLYATRPDSMWVR